MASEAANPTFNILDVPLNNNTESLELDLDEICGTDGTVNEIVEIFVGEKLSVKFWTRGVMEYWRRDLREAGLSLGEQGILALRAQGRSEECLPLLCQLVTGLICLAKNLPTSKLEAANYDILPETQPIREEYLLRATQYVNEATNIEKTNPLVLDARVVLLLAKKDFDQVFNTCEEILKDRPNHLPALLGKARVLFHRKYYRSALKIYQHILSIAPQSLPDPRVGIGCCFWFLGDFGLAKRAWQRSIAVNPGKPSQGAQVLLGLMHFHTSRDLHLSDEAKLAAYQEGISHIQGAFMSNRNTASAAAVLASHFLTANNWTMATKMAERAVQYADANPILFEARLVLARAFHAQGKLVEAQKEYQAAVALDRSILNPVLGVAQIMVAQNEYGLALNTFENVLRRQPRCIEALANLAALRTHLAFTSSSSTEAAAEKIKARDLYEQITRLFATRIKKANASADDPGFMPPRIREVASDPDLYIDIARLSTDIDIGRALKGYSQSLTVRKDLEKPIPAMLFNNIGVLDWKNGNLREAQEQIECALAATASAVVGDEMERETNERAAVCMLYNLGVVCEDSGDKDKSKDIYERILLRHPEYVDAKARLALMYLSGKNFEKANGLLKEALTSQTGNGELRALYTYFLIESNQIKQARDFSVATLKDHDKQDIYALCASGALLYTQARENKNPGPEASMERTNRFFRAAEFFEKAIQLDPHCAFAAQGLAIALAEHVIGATNSSSGGQGTTSDGNAIRAKNIRDAITIFTKVKEASNDGSVYVNLGHCYYLRDEFDRSIENYNTASKRFYHNKNIQVLLYLARAWFQKASKDQSFTSLRNALTNAQAAQSLNSRDAAIAFNVALIQQRGLELLLDLEPAKRTLSDIKIAIADAQAAQEAFGHLASQKPGSVPFETDIAHQRKRYGDSLLRRTTEIQDSQQLYESSESAKVQRARDEREAERQKIAEAERSRLQEMAARNEELARKRQEMQESAATWYVKRESDNESDGGGKKKKKQGATKRKPKDTGVTIVEDGNPNDYGSEVEEKKPKRKRAKKQKDRDNTIRAVSTADDEVESDEAPTLKSTKRKSNKIYKSAEFIEDESE
ncbi:hypothetical protein CROQUDRAFT_47010 [Cronartium quercuum f. sp. fusiforme G11]|uniref:Uncharacterized protein n=1 Tax=Cronartium quercuum f. sp. fusiforme G11 TaxID=708437 RepID=A0A9P6TBJ1_9BASI|nr:hypothetical protein CROQUDRAFT_47010 [Cronartium quercuum f. sp. fusiforme G11]